MEIAAVVRGAFEQTVIDDGKTRVRDRYVVSAPLAGPRRAHRLEAGDAVAQGADGGACSTPTAPAFLDARTARELQERIGAAEAQRARARAESAEGRRRSATRRAPTSNGRRKLAQEGFVSATAREQAELALRTAERAVEAARFAEDAAGHEVAQARAALVRYQQRRGGPRSGK